MNEEMRHGHLARAAPGSPLRGLQVTAASSGIGDRMKSECVFMIIALLVSFLLPACTQYADTRSTNNALWGAWNWESSSGGFTGKQIITPETAGYTKRIRFSPEGEYREFHNGDLVITARYAVVAKKTIFGPHEVLCFSDSTGRLSDKVIMRVTATSVHFSDPYPDGYGHTYVRVEE
jgi:hypothetical protein